ncbi:helix-turn-helix transcriptional regulator [Enterococcus florum]|nr:helix-turn-helix transcriptional regulator [Enterococcus florum]
MKQKAVLPFLTQQLPIIFNEYTFWQNKILNRILKINKIYSKSKELHWQYQIAVELVTIWNELLPYFSKSQSQRVSKQHVRQKNARDARTYCKNFQKELTLEKIAAVAHVSISECSRTFKDFTNYSPYEYLLQYRIREAANRILVIDDKIEVIAIQTGFKDGSSFIQAFRKNTVTISEKYQI